MSLIVGFQAWLVLHYYNFCDGLKYCWHSQHPIRVSLRARPLMICGGAEKILDANFFFLAEAFLNFFFPREGLFKFFFPRWGLLKIIWNLFFFQEGILKFFFPGEGPSKFFFLDFLRPPPSRSLMVEPLQLSTHWIMTIHWNDIGNLFWVVTNIQGTARGQWKMSDKCQKKCFPGELAT